MCSLFTRLPNVAAPSDHLLAMGYIPSLYTASQAVLSAAALGVVSTAVLLYRYQRNLIYPSSFPSGSRSEVMLPDQFGVVAFSNSGADGHLEFGRFSFGVNPPDWALPKALQKAL